MADCEKPQSRTLSSRFLREAHEEILVPRSFRTRGQRRTLWTVIENGRTCQDGRYFQKLLKPLVKTPKNQPTNPPNLHVWLW